MEVEHSAEGPDHIVWCHAGIVLRFARLTERSADVTGLCRISLLAFPGRNDGDLYDGKLTLTGSNSIRDAAKACDERVPEFTDWRGLITKACQLVRRALEEGTPIIDLATVEIEDEEPYVLEPILRNHENALVFGDGGTGKSTLALWWAMQVPGKTLFLDYEDDAPNVAEHLRELAKGMDVPVPHLLYKRADASLPLMQDGLARQLAQHNIDGLIVDSAGLACGAEPETADSANAYFRALRPMHLRWTLTIAHQPKAKEKSPLPFGSVFWWNNPRTIWQTRREQEEGADSIRVGIWHRKSNNGPLQKPLGYDLRFSDGATTVHSMEVRDEPAFRTSLSQPEQVLAALEDAGGQPLTYKELALRTGISLTNIYKVVDRTKRAAKAPGQAGFVLDEYA